MSCIVSIYCWSMWWNSWMVRYTSLSRKFCQCKWEKNIVAQSYKYLFSLVQASTPLLNLYHIIMMSLSFHYCNLPKEIISASKRIQMFQHATAKNNRMSGLTNIAKTTACKMIMDQIHAFSPNIIFYFFRSYQYLWSSISKLVRNLQDRDFFGSSILTGSLFFY